MQDHDSQEVQIQALFFAQFHFPEDYVLREEHPMNMIKMHEEILSLKMSTNKRKKPISDD